MTVANDVKNVTDHLTQRTMQVLVMLMAETDARLKMKSPVDTGRFRASWTIGLGQPDPNVSPEAVKGQVIASPEPRIPALVMGQTYYHGNSLPYARRLEYGWSKKAPQGMVRVTALEVPGIIAALTAQV